MLTREEAHQSLLKRLDAQEDSLDEFIEEHRTIERSCGWLFFMALASNRAQRRVK
jgi:hypothetical protein